MRITESDLQKILGKKVPSAGINKYFAKITEVDNIKFSSKKEAQYYAKLKFEREIGAIKYFHRQIRFDLPGNTKYICDFQIFNNDGTVTYIDVKGWRLKEFIRNKKQVEALFPVKIIEV